MKTNMKNQKNSEHTVLKLGGLLMTALTIFASTELSKQIEAVLLPQHMEGQAIHTDFMRKEKESVHEQYSYMIVNRTPQISGS